MSHFGINMPDPKKVVVYSLDYDHCCDVPKDVDPSMIGEYNKKVIEDMIASAKEGHDVVQMIGSNRQDLKADYDNSEKNGNRYCYEVFPAMARYVDEQTKQTANRGSVTFDGMLTADIAGQSKEPGASFKSYTKSSQPLTKSPKAESFPDESKISTIYAQMQHIAAKNEGKEVEFKFYEDNTAILDGIHDFFSAHPDLMPKNVQLHLVNHISDKAVKKNEKCYSLLNELSKSLNDQSEERVKEKFSQFKNQYKDDADLSKLLKEIKDDWSAEQIKSRITQTIANIEAQRNLKAYSPIQGKGEVDKNYMATVRGMWFEVSGQVNGRAKNTPSPENINWSDPNVPALGSLETAKKGYMAVGNELSAIMVAIKNYLRVREEESSKTGIQSLNSASMDRFKSSEKSSKTKLSAATKISNYLSNKSLGLELDQFEIAALNNGRLKKIYQTHKASFPENITVQMDNYSKSCGITQKFREVLQSLRGKPSAKAELDAAETAPSKSSGNH